MSEYFTVSQYAEFSGKDPGNIRKMLINGTLKGEKIGNQWAIPKGTTLPKDQRVKSGEYRNWRLRKQLNARHPAVLKTLIELCKALEKVYADRMDRVILYGSYARGQEVSESDVDLAILLNDDQSAEQYDKMTDILVDYELELGVTLSVISINKQEFLDWRETLPFYKNVEKEGIVLSHFRQKTTYD